MISVAGCERCVPVLAARLPARNRVLVTLAVLASGIAALLAGASDGRAQNVDLGEENSWIRIQNVGGQPATIEVLFYDLDGTQIATDGCPVGGCVELRPGLGWSFFQQGYGGLPEGYRGSAYVTASQPFVALLARDAFKGGEFQIAGDTLRLGSGSPEQYAPIVQNTAEYVSRISVENASEDLDGCFELRFYQQGAATPAAVDPPGPTAGCPNGGWLVRPRATLLRDEQSMPVPANFDGSVVLVSRATASGAAARAQQPSMIVDTRERGGAGLATYRAFGGDELQNVVVLPLVDRNASERGTSWSTRFRILNATPGKPNEVTLLFTGTDGAGNATEIEHKILVLSSVTCDQRPGSANNCLPAGEALPDTFVGAVRISAVDPVAVVVQRLGSNGALADYRGFTADEASREVVLPVLNREYGPGGSDQAWNSWFRVMSFDGTPARVQVIYYSSATPNGVLTNTGTVDPLRTMRQWEEPRIPNDWVGSAIVIADRPIVVVANLESDVFEGDPAMMYNGVSLD